MDASLVERLMTITSEEQELLSGRSGIDRSLYMRSDSAEVDGRLLLEKGKLITLRPHTRFVHFPKHTHNYVEMVYMCRGETTHIISGSEVVLKSGELLLLGQNAVQEILPAGEGDVAVNFIILPQFFDTAIAMLNEDETSIRRFLLHCQKGEMNEAGYLHFQVSDILPIQNLVENLIWTLVNRQINKRHINQLTMGLLFLQLANHTEALSDMTEMPEKKLMMQIRMYVEENYASGSLQEIARQTHYDPCWLSREIKKETGKTFTELMQEKRLAQAGFLLKTTGLRVIDICQRVGYDNLSYFHRLFRDRYGTTPYQYRKCK